MAMAQPIHAPAPLREHMATRVARLEAHYRWVQQARMAGVPLLHPRLQVMALGFEPLPAEAAPAQAQGLLITPWFMSLVQLSLATPARAEDVEAGTERTLAFGREQLSFLATPAPGLGTLWCCSLFSPMHEFADQAQAMQTAQTVLGMLRGAAPTGASATPHDGTPARSATPAPSPLAAPSRRAFLTGRR